jgi:signal transduction histidine kinase
MLEQPKEAVSKRLRGIDEAVSRMTMLIDRFFANERQVDGVLKVEEVDISALVSQVQHHFDQVGLGRRLRFTRIEDVQDYWADVEMLRTIVVNLVDNALKYSPQDETVEIALFVRNNLLIIEVSDKGIGVPAGEQSHVGRRFFRASNTRATAGSGLGLHNCQQLLAYHEGSLNLRPQGDRGTIATVRLPMPGLLPENLGKPKEDVPA